MFLHAEFGKCTCRICFWMPSLIYIFTIAPVRPVPSCSTVRRFLFHSRQILPPPFSSHSFPSRYHCCNTSPYPQPRHHHHYFPLHHRHTLFFSLFILSYFGFTFVEVGLLCWSLCFIYFGEPCIPVSQLFGHVYDYRIQFFYFWWLNEDGASEVLDLGLHDGGLERENGGQCKTQWCAIVNGGAIWVYVWSALGCEKEVVMMGVWRGMWEWFDHGGWLHCGRRIFIFAFFLEYKIIELFS